MTKPHKKRVNDKQYTMRVGKNVPPEGVSLSYIGNKKELESIAKVNVSSNVEYYSDTEAEEVMHADEDGYLRSSRGRYNINSPNVLITNIFTDDADREPLYYKFEATYPIKYDFELAASEYYHGEDFTVFELHGELSEDQRYEAIVSHREDDDLANLTIYTNFDNDVENTYFLVYNAYDPEAGREIKNYEEVMLFEPALEEVEDIPRTEEQFRVIDDGEGTYKIQVDYESLIEPDIARTPDRFQYKVDTKLDSFFNATGGREKELNIGGVFLEESRVEIQEFIRFLDVLESEDKIPPGIDVKNPHPYDVMSDDKSDPDWIQRAHEEERGEVPNYWKADLDMPMAHYHDYDLIIITGYGEIELTDAQKEKIDEYLKCGGNIWIDNSDALEVDNYLTVRNFIDGDIEFNELDSSDLSLEDEFGILTRLTEKEDIAEISPNSYISLDNSYTKIIYDDDKSIAAIKTYKDRGKILVTSAGISHKSPIGSEPHEKVIKNILARFTESKWYTTGYLNSGVLRRDTLLPIDYEDDFPIHTYIDGYREGDDDEVVGLRQVLITIRTDISNFIPTLKQRDDVRHFIDYKSESGEVRISPEREEYGPRERVNFYTDRYTNRWDIDIMTLDEVDIHFPGVDFNYTIEAMPYYYDEEDGTYKLEENLANINYATREAHVREEQGNVSLGRITSIAPGVRSIEEDDWSDKSKVYYRIRCGEYIDNQFYEDDRVNLYLLDRRTGRYIVKRDGSIMINECEIDREMVLMASTDHTYKAIKTNKYSVKIQPEPIVLKEPRTYNKNSPWYLRVRSGNYKQSLDISKDPEGNTTPTLTNTYRYTVPEYYNQAFYPPGQSDTKYIAGDIPRFIDNYEVKLLHVPIDDTKDIKIYRRHHSVNNVTGEELQQEDEEGYVFKSKNTNWVKSPPPKFYSSSSMTDEDIIDPENYKINHKEGKIEFRSVRSDIFADYSYANDEELTIESLEPNSGYVRVREQISHLDNILADYYYVEEYLEYKGYYDEEEDIFWHLDLNPTLGHTITYPDIENGEIKTSNKDTYRLLGEKIYVYMIPSYDELYGEENNYTIRHTFKKEHWEYIRDSIPGALLLGVVQVREHNNIDDLVVMDTRRRGGGLKEHYSRRYISNTSRYNPDTYWDIGGFNNITYPSQGVVSVVLPKKALERRKVSDEEIEKAVKSHLSLGVVPSIKFTDGDTIRIKSGIIVE